MCSDAFVISRAKISQVFIKVKRFAEAHIATKQIVNTENGKEEEKKGAVAF